MTIQELYESLGGDYQETLQRLVMDSLIERLVVKFPGDLSMTQLREAIAAGNVEESFRAAHTLKGLTDNLGFTNLTLAASALTEQLRPLPPEVDRTLVEKLQEEYDRTLALIKQYEENHE